MTARSMLGAVERAVARPSHRSIARATDLTRLAIFALALVVVSVASVAIDWSGTEIVREGEVADQTIKSPVTMTFQSDLRTEELRREAYNDARNVVRVTDEAVRGQQVDAAERFLAEAERLRSEATRPAADRAADLRAMLEGLSIDDAQRLLALSDASWERVRSEVLRLIDNTLADSIADEDVARTKEELPRHVSALLTPDEQALAATVARPFVRANVVIDEARTLENRQRAAQAVDPVMVTVLAGQAVIRDGDVVTKYDIEKLEKLGLLEQQTDLATRLGRTGLMLLVTAVLVGFLYRFHRSVWRGRQVLLLSLVVLGPLVMARLVLPHPEIQYMFPAAAAAMLLAVLLDFEIAAIVAAFMAIYIGVLGGMSLELVVLYFLSSIAGAWSIWRAERTVTFLLSGLAVAATTFVVGLCFQTIEAGVTSPGMLELGIEALVNGALSSSLTFLSFSLLGQLFGITTHLQLMELAHPSQPLLYRLAREAPGTYHHSIVVSNLAESGVEAVGGDPLFARVAVLYHDVGKIVRPTFFIENQAHIENPHDLLDPRVSARVIIDHVIDGARLARKARLPQPLIDIILQHHGTSLIRYFHKKARETSEDVDESEFRYPGPKPQTKEAGVIMLADSVEAAVRAAAASGRLAHGRAVEDTRGETLPEIVHRIIQERLDDGQLDECDLTLREVALIGRIFVQVLEGIYHPRIDYPQPELQPRPAIAVAE